VTVNLFKSGFVSPCACVIERKCIDGTRFDEALENAEDSDFFLRLSVLTEFLFLDDLIVEINVTPKSLSDKINCNRIRSLERFYFKLGNINLIPSRVANKKFSKSYRQTAQNYILLKNYEAASYLLRRAIQFNPYRLNLYLEYIYAKILSFLIISSDWKPPEPLGMPITAAVDPTELVKENVTSPAGLQFSAAPIRDLEASGC
jgi:hypothetical protein